MPIRILSVASEAVPLLKTGGLADVAGALPAALAAHDCQMRVLMPLYRGMAALPGRPRQLWHGADIFGGPARVLATEIEGVQFLLLDAPHLYDRAGGPYGDPADFPDNPERYAALCWVAVALAAGQGSDGWRAEILHAHDWQGALAASYLRAAAEPAIRSVLTIHNIAFQGIAPADRIAALRLDPSGFTQEGYEYWGRISMLKAGLVAADRITTVSPTYAGELMREAFGMGLQGVLAGRAAVLSGILNGIDDAIWNPATDRHSTRPYSVGKMAGKARCRAALLAEFGLEDGGGPVAIVVSRLTEQKGIDLVSQTAPEFIAAGGRLAILGTGDAGIEAALKRLARLHPGRIGLQIGYDEALSHRMFAGADAVLVPSRFEPCGLTQMYGLRYGAVPVVASTGGLRDSVIDANPAAMRSGVATGIQFAPTDAMGLAEALRRLVDLHGQPAQWRRLQRNGMTQDQAWTASAAAYAALYRSLVA